MSQYDRIDSLDDLRNDWTTLAKRSGNVFATWEWASTWWHHFGAAGELELLRLKHDGRAFAIAPLYSIRRGPLRVVRFIGHGPGDVLGPVCAPEDRGVAGEALLEALRDGAAGRWHVFLAERIPVGPLGMSLAGTVLQSEASPALDVGGRSWEEYLAESSRNLREKLRRNTRKLEREHELSYELCEDPERLGGALEALFRLHEQRWSGNGAFAREAVVAFHRDFAAIALERGWLRLWTMKLDGEVVAAWYGFRLGSTEFYYQSGRNTDFDRFSIGFLMLMRTLQGAFDDGLARYAFLRGDEPYKDRFATGGESLETRALGNGTVLSAGVRVGSTALGWPWLRQRVTAAMR